MKNGQPSLTLPNYPLDLLIMVPNLDKSWAIFIKTSDFIKPGSRISGDFPTQREDVTSASSCHGASCDSTTGYATIKGEDRGLEQQPCGNSGVDSGFIGVLHGKHDQLETLGCVCLCHSREMPVVRVFKHRDTM